MRISTRINADEILPGLKPDKIPGYKPDTLNNLPRYQPDISPGLGPDISGNHPGNSSGRYPGKLLSNKSGNHPGNKYQRSSVLYLRSSVVHGLIRLPSGRDFKLINTRIFIIL